MAHRAAKSIGWADWVSNTIKGRCIYAQDGRACARYCYMERIFERFGGDQVDPDKRLNPTLRLDEAELSWKPPPDCLVWVGSSSDIIHPDVPYDWLARTFEWMEKYPATTFAILTKNPAGYEDFEDILPHNLWLGTTCDGLPHTWDNIHLLGQANGLRFVSLEPLKMHLTPLDMDDLKKSIRWVIVGGDSTRGAKKPPDAWLDAIIEAVEPAGIPVWLKDNYHYEGRHGVLKQRPPLYQARPVYDSDIVILPMGGQ